jgi:hypothetical protein
MQQNATLIFFFLSMFVVVTVLFLRFVAERKKKGLILFIVVGFISVGLID